MWSTGSHWPLSSASGDHAGDKPSTNNSKVHGKKGKVKFPWKSYEQIQWLIEHCCSMEKEIRTQQGRITTRFVKGTGPNDGLMALMYAYLAFKFYQTKGFNIKPHRLTGKSDSPVIAYLPGV